MTVTPDVGCVSRSTVPADAGAIDPDTPLALLGLDSLSTIEMAADLEEAFGCELPPDLLNECTDARTLASAISALRAKKRDGSGDDPFDAMLADSVLPDDVRPVRRAGISTDLRSARRILLTGATGFLGSALMHELLGSTAADIVCLVRTPGAWARPVDALHSARVRMVAGDLSRVQLGLGEAHFNELAGQVDAVVHCGAAVNWVYTYSGLRAANVSGTLELLRLACPARHSVSLHLEPLGLLRRGRPGCRRREVRSAAASARRPPRLRAEQSRRRSPGQGSGSPRAARPHLPAGAHLGPQRQRGLQRVGSDHRARPWMRADGHGSRPRLEARLPAGEPRRPIDSRAVRQDRPDRFTSVTRAPAAGANASCGCGCTATTSG